MTLNRFAGLSLGMILALPAGMALAQDADFAAGEMLFANKCAACHGAGGQGGVGLPLAGNENLAGEGYALRVMLNGNKMMPAFASSLDDIQAAQIATFIRNAWGNDFGAVTQEDAAAAR